MEYNTAREHLIIAEYGRNVQKMVAQLLKVEQRDERTAYADLIVELMATLNPGIKSVENYEHKLWDHLHIISDFQLDVDSPYPAPTREEVNKKPDPLPYPQRKSSNRHFGQNLTRLIDTAINEKDDEKRQELTQLIGYYMKLAYVNWHREPVHDDMIRNELSVLTDGKLQYEQGGYKVYFDNRQNYSNKNNKNRKGGGSRHNNGGYNKNRRYNKNRNK